MCCLLPATRREISIPGLSSRDISSINCGHFSRRLFVLMAAAVLAKPISFFAHLGHPLPAFLLYITDWYDSPHMLHFHQTLTLIPDVTLSGVNGRLNEGCHSAAMLGCVTTMLFCFSEINDVDSIV